MSGFSGNQRQTLIHGSGQNIDGIQGHNSSSPLNSSALAPFINQTTTNPQLFSTHNFSQNTQHYHPSLNSQLVMTKHFQPHNPNQLIPHSNHLSNQFGIHNSSSQSPIYPGHLLPSNFNETNLNGHSNTQNWSQNLHTTTSPSGATSTSSPASSSNNLNNQSNDNYQYCNNAKTSSSYGLFPDSNFRSMHHQHNHIQSNHDNSSLNLNNPILVGPNTLVSSSGIVDQCSSLTDPNILNQLNNHNSNKSNANSNNQTSRSRLESTGSSNNINSSNSNAWTNTSNNSNIDSNPNMQLGINGNCFNEW